MRPRGVGVSDGPPAPAGGQTVKAVVLILALLIVGVAVLHHDKAASVASIGQSTSNTTAHTSKSKGKSTTSTTTVGVTTTTVPILAPSQVKVQVLNGANFAASYGSLWSKKLQTVAGYDTLSPDNAKVKVTASAIYVLTPGFVPEALHLAQVVGLPPGAVVTTVPPPATAPIPTRDHTANIVFVVGPNSVAGA